MRSSSLILIASSLAFVTEQVSAQWPNLCPTSGTYSAWNETRCPETATCCPNAFSVTGQGCCPFQNAVCCPSGFQCCQEGTQCVPISGSSYSTVYECVANTVSQGTSKCPCKPGPPLPPSTTLKNVLIIGDSLSIGYTPDVKASLADVALVQHAPFDVSDGGAEETAYGVQCLDYWLRSPSGMTYDWDVIYFNFGMHDYQTNCLPGYGCVPGQSGNTTVYPGELQNITDRLVAYAAANGGKTKLVYGLTTAYMCNTTIDTIINGTLNGAAREIMTAAGIPMVDLHEAIIGKCGLPPNPSCDNSPGCFCPHCPPLYEWLSGYVTQGIQNVLTDN